MTVSLRVAHLRANRDGDCVRWPFIVWMISNSLGPCCLITFHLSPGKRLMQIRANFWILASSLKSSGFWLLQCVSHDVLRWDQGQEEKGVRGLWYDASVERGLQGSYWMSFLLFTSSDGYVANSYSDKMTPFPLRELVHILTDNGDMKQTEKQWHVFYGGGSSTSCLLCRHSATWAK
jgi:hypothetical protein